MVFLFFTTLVRMLRTFSRTFFRQWKNWDLQYCPTLQFCGVSLSLISEIAQIIHTSTYLFHSPSLHCAFSSKVTRHKPHPRDPRHPSRRPVHPHNDKDVAAKRNRFSSNLKTILTYCFHDLARVPVRRCLLVVAPSNHELLLKFSEFCSCSPSRTYFSEALAQKEEP